MPLAKCIPDPNLPVRGSGAELASDFSAAGRQPGSAAGTLGLRLAGTVTVTVTATATDWPGLRRRAGILSDWPELRRRAGSLRDVRLENR